MTEHLDVVIVGAGISGVSAAWHLQDRCPTKSYAILEKRESMGGTWDLFRYPGIRSDSDMYTLGFRFRPWTGRQAIADGKPILEYVKSTAAMYGIDRHIRFHHKVISADWSTAENRWTVHIQSHGTLSALTCEFLFLCSGYYNYDEGYSPRFAGSEDFVGPIIHPQHWPEDLDYDAKNIVVIGSGATAVTLVPALADSGAKGMMLSGIPNMAYTVGYTNASWTLKADLVSEFVCRLLNYMDDNGFDTVVVERPGSDVEERPFMEFTPGYVLRSLDELPKQGSRTPWRLNQNYLRDIRLIRRGKIDDEGLRFAKRPAPVGV
ncbi:flavin-containing monooxygenase [Mycobacterium tuberculosis]|uniref:flavin-containing monooxygenase n=1 Tax=Mycobacterium tuberculosis TaxID=1773 RepID=UPI0008A89104|nr:NAD(P)/FAD-dependent oxidoreductase [Mycobacterium tuberculosis]